MTVDDKLLVLWELREPAAQRIKGNIESPGDAAVFCHLCLISYVE
jgi:hypothetical protein